MSEENEKKTRRHLVPRAYVVIEINPEKTGVEAFVGHELVLSSDEMMERMSKAGWALTHTFVSINTEELKV